MTRDKAWAKLVHKAAACVVVAITLFVAPKYALADGTGTQIDATISSLRGKVTFYAASGSYGAAYRTYSFEGKLKGIKSSNPKVVSVNRYEGYPFVDILAKKAGKANITYKLDGKNYTASITVKKYVNPFKKIAMGGVNYTGKFKKSRVLNVDPSKFAGKKLAIKLRKGWMLKSVTCVVQTKKSGLQEKRIKTGKSIPSGIDGTRPIWITLQNTTTKGLLEVPIGKFY